MAGQLGRSKSLIGLITPEFFPNSPQEGEEAADSQAGVETQNQMNGGATRYLDADK